MAFKRIEYIFEERSNGKLPTHKQAPRKYKNHHKENEKIRKEKRKEFMNLKRDFSTSLPPSPSPIKKNSIDNVIKQFANMALPKTKKALPKAKKALPKAKKALPKAKKKITRRQIAKRKRIFKKILKKKKH